MRLLLLMLRAGQTKVKWRCCATRSPMSHFVKSHNIAHTEISECLLQLETLAPNLNRWLHSYHHCGETPIAPQDIFKTLYGNLNESNNCLLAYSEVTLSDSVNMPVNIRLTVLLCSLVVALLFE